MPLRYLRGAYTHPLVHAIRSTDGVRGVFLRAPIQAGGLLFSVPLRYCHFPTGIPSSLDRDELTAAEAMRLRRANRGKELFPEFWLWLKRLSPDMWEERVSLASSVSEEHGRVASVQLSPVEAALTVCVGLRYFFGPALGLPTAVARRVRQTGCFPSSSSVAVEAVADRYVASLPMGLCMAHGVESLFMTDGEEAGQHACLEQISHNLRDACLTYATADQYRWMDENPSLLDAVLLTALYTVRSRTLTVPLLSSVDARLDRSVCVLAPGLDQLNHAPAQWNTAVAAVASRHGVLVVRATRTARKGEEITIDYQAHGNTLATRYLVGSSSQTPVGATPLRAQ